MMNKYKAFYLVFAFLSFTISCSENDLELVNPNTLSPDTFFTDGAQVESAVNAAYVNMQTFALYGRLLFYMYDNMSQENSGNPQQEADKVTYANYSYDSSNGQIADFWDSCFRGVNKSNFVIDNAEKINTIPESLLNSATKNKYIAEARFLRAHYYFLLVTRFGDVPLFNKLPEGAEGLPRSPKSEIWNLITEDLRFASLNLLDKSSEDPGRATKGAALSYLGKVLLYQEKYAEALVELNKVSGYTLEDDYYNNFKEETEHGPESIFEVEYNIAVGSADKWASPVGGEGFDEVTFRGQDYGVLNWFNVYPSNDLLSEFEDGDARYADSFYSVGDSYNNDQDAITEANLTVGTDIRPAAWKKYQNYYKQTSENEESGINVKVIRYADVLLMQAECENEAGNQAGAAGLINQVRARAGLDALSTSLSQTAVFDAVVHERKVELAGEQVRFDDILRWGLTSTELAGTNFQQGKHELWPIPDKEISSNDAISSADQNPGY